ncbi:MAG: hypothetical protein AAFR88_13555, partial [Pseudomonadota bacterium]
PLLKPGPRQLLHALGLDTRRLEPSMLPVLAKGDRVPAGYRPAGEQLIRVDLAEKILRGAFEARMQAAKPKASASEPAQSESKAKPEEKAPEPAEQSGSDPAESVTPVEQTDKKPIKPDRLRKSKAPRERNARFRIDLALAISIGLEGENAQRLLGSAGFRLHRARALAEGAHGPLAPDLWTWRPRRIDEKPARRRSENKERAKGRRSKVKSDPDNLKQVNKGKPRGKRPPKSHAKPDTGPARSGGAFDALADLLGK